jgi:hypothetical protein
MVTDERFTGTVLALDLATVAGWALGKPGSTPKFGTMRFGKPGASRASIYRVFRTWMDGWSGPATTPDLIVYELPMQPLHMRGKTSIDTSKMLIGLAEHLEEWCFDVVELREATVGQVRSHFIGQNLKSEFAKPATVERCQMLGWKVNNTDEADACALWDYQCGFLRPDLAHKTTPLFRRR